MIIEATVEETSDGDLSNFSDEENISNQELLQMFEVFIKQNKSQKGS